MIASMMLSAYKEKKWMWWKSTDQDIITNQRQYLFVGGLVIPLNSTTMQVPLNLVPNFVGATGCNYNMGVNVGNITLNISNIDPTSAVNFSASFSSGGVFQSQLFSNQNLAAGNNLNANFTVTQPNSQLFITWTNLGAGLNFSFNIQTILRTYPVSIPAIDTKKYGTRKIYSLDLFIFLQNGGSLFR
jgi:hypothetical protein